MKEIRNKGWSLNPGRYVGVAEVDEDDGKFFEKLGQLKQEFTELTDEAHVLEAQIKEVLDSIIEREEE